MTSVVSIWNMAMGSLGINANIQNQDEKSAEAGACRNYYDAALRSALSGYDWNFARRYKDLARVSDTVPTDRWTYAYSLPDDCVAVRKIDDGTRTNNNKVPFEVGVIGEKRVLYCNQESCKIIYTAMVTNPNLFEPQFITSLQLYLASLTCMQLTRKADMQQLLVRNASMITGSAAAQTLNETGTDQLPEAPSVEARV